jgi:hypothetical protein
MSTIARFVNLLELGLLALNLVMSGHVFDADAAPAGRDPMTGRIVLVTDKDIVLEVSSHQHRIAVTERTEITLDGNATELMRLPLGCPAVVTTEGQAPTKAVSIHATTMKWSRGNELGSEKRGVAR